MSNTSVLDGFVLIDGLEETLEGFQNIFVRDVQRFASLECRSSILRNEPSTHKQDVVSPSTKIVLKKGNDVFVFTFRQCATKDGLDAFF